MPKDESMRDLADFLANPKHQADKDFLFGVVNAAVDARLQKEKENAPPEEVHFLDRLLGGKK